MSTRADAPSKGRSKTRSKRRNKEAEAEEAKAAPQQKFHLTGAQRCALFMLSLDEESAAEVFRHMEAGEIRRIMSAMTNLQNIPTRVVQKVFEDFAHFVRHEPVLLEGGADYLRHALDRAVGSDQARLLLGEEVPPPPKEEMTLAKVDPRTLANVLEEEHPQTVALLMTNLEARQAAKVLSSMKPEMQEDVMNRIARMDRVSPDVVADIEASIMAELSGISVIEQKNIKGTKQAAALLNNMDRALGVQLLERLSTQDETLAEQVRFSMFSFEDLIHIADRGLQTILKEISSDVLLIALKTASPELREKFFRNMSSRAAEMVREDLAVMGPVRLADVEGAQREIAQVALRLQEEGSIVLAGAGDEMV